jgi:hypothetical protein
MNADKSVLVPSALIGVHRRLKNLLAFGASYRAS